MPQGREQEPEKQFSAVRRTVGDRFWNQVIKKHKLGPDNEALLENIFKKWDEPNLTPDEETLIFHGLIFDETKKRKIPPKTIERLSQASEELNQEYAKRSQQARGTFHRN